MLKLTPDGAEFIARWEGFRSRVYRDAVWLPTIGFGHLIRPGEEWTSISEADALDLLMIDATREAAPVAERLLYPLNPYQTDALISLACNCGGYAIARSTLVRFLNAGISRAQVADEFLRWNRAGGQVVRGLTKRRHAERSLFLFADYSGSP